MSAASGSHHRLNSAAAVRLPNVPPPMSEMPAMRPGQVGCGAQRERDVGQRPGGHQPDALLGAAGLDDEADGVVCWPAGRSARAGRRRPCRSCRGRSRRAVAARISGRLAPEWTGQSMPSRSRMMIALRVVASSGALPATVVMPTRLVWRAATTMAIASSWPGSQSRMIGQLVGAAWPYSLPLAVSCPSAVEPRRCGPPIRPRTSRQRARRRSRCPTRGGRRPAGTRRARSRAGPRGSASRCTPRPSRRPAASAGSASSRRGIASISSCGYACRNGVAGEWCCTRRTSAWWRTRRSPTPARWRRAGRAGRASPWRWRA